MTQAKTQDGAVDDSATPDPKSETPHPETQEEPLALTGARAPGIYRGLVSIAAAVIIFWGLRSLSFILAPLLMAMVITVAIVPLPGLFMKRGMKSGVALILTILLVLGVLAMTVFVVVGSLGKLSGLLPSYSADFSGRFLPLDSSSGVSTSTALTGTVQTVTPVPGAATSGAESIENILAKIPSVKSVVSPQQVSGVTTAVVIAVGQLIGQLFLVLFIFAFMLSAALSTRGRTIGGFSENSPGMKSFEAFTHEVRQYVNLMTQINLMVAVGDTLLLWALGIPSALLWGFLAFLMGYIPAVGWWISLIPPFFLAWAEFGIGKALVVFVAYIVINGGVQNIIQPRIMGRGLSMSPLVVFVSVIIWTTVLGWMGALISIPLTLIVLKLLESSETTRWIAAIMRFGSGSDKEESKEAVEKLRGYTGNWWDRLSLGLGTKKSTHTNGVPPTVESMDGADQATVTTRG